MVKDVHRYSDSFENSTAIKPPSLPLDEPGTCFPRSWPYESGRMDQQMQVRPSEGDPWLTS
jgi:hypothetical protein